MIVFLAYLVGVLIVIAIEWAIVCGVVYILSLCFHFTFDLLFATGVWVVYEMVANTLKAIFKKK